MIYQNSMKFKIVVEKYEVEELSGLDFNSKDQISDLIFQSLDRVSEFREL